MECLSLWSQFSFLPGWAWAILRGQGCRTASISAEKYPIAFDIWVSLVRACRHLSACSTLCCVRMTFVSYTSCCARITFALTSKWYLSVELSVDNYHYPCSVMKNWRDTSAIGTHWPFCHDFTSDETFCSHESCAAPVWLVFSPASRNLGYCFFLFTRCTQFSKMFSIMKYQTGFTAWAS